MALYVTARHPQPRSPEGATRDSADERREHISARATAGLVTGIFALAAMLTGLLAPLGIALGTMSLVICVSSLATAHSPNVTRRGLALIGVITALTAVVLATLAMSGDYAWPNSDANDVDQLHTWLNQRWPWLERW